MTCNTCDIATLNICVQNNEDWVQSFEMRSGRDIIDLTGWAIEMQIRDGFDAPSLVSVDSSTPTGNGSIIEIADAANGIIEIRIKQADLAALTIPAADRRKRFRHDVRFTDPVPMTSVLIRGEFEIQRGVTF